MCHGLFDQRATISVPDLLRNQCFHVSDNERKEEAAPNDYDSGSTDLSILEGSLVQPESSVLSEDAFADLVNDFSSAVKKFDAEAVGEADALASTGSFSTWFDCINEDLVSGVDSVTKTPLVDVKEDQPSKDAAPEPVTKSRKARKSAVKEQSHVHHHDSEMEDGAPVLIDEKRKRRMSSNRASAQRSRQRKQERLDELEILTAQLRLENATLSRKSKMAEQLAKRIAQDKNELAKKVEELRKQLEAARFALSNSLSDSGDDSINTSVNLEAGVCDMIEGGETSAFEVKAVPKGINNGETVGTVTVDTRKRNLSTTDEVSHGMFQDLYDVIDSDQFDVCLGAEVPELLREEWYGSFTECLNAE